MSGAVTRRASRKRAINLASISVRREIIIGGWIALFVVLRGVLGVAGTGFSNLDRLPRQTHSES
jgi:hypothetical protein